IDEAARQPRDPAGIVAAVELVDALDHLGEERRQALEATLPPGTILRDGEHPRLGLVEQLAGVPSIGIERRAGDVVRRADEPAQQRAIADDLAVATYVGRRRRLLSERIEI